MDTSALLVAPLKSEDNAAVRQLLIMGLTERWGTYDASLNPDIENFPAGYGDSTTVVAKLSGQVVGTGTLKTVNPGRAEVVRMAVIKPNRRSGIGSTILTHLLDLALEQGKSEVILETTTTWQSAVDFYTRRGFHKTHEQDGDTWFRRVLGEA